VIFESIEDSATNNRAGNNWKTTSVTWTDAPQTLSPVECATSGDTKRPPTRTSIPFPAFSTRSVTWSLEAFVAVIISQSVYDRTIQGRFCENPRR
jgi:hypothetical protein